MPLGRARRRHAAADADVASPQTADDLTAPPHAIAGFTLQVTRFRTVEPAHATSRRGRPQNAARHREQPAPGAQGQEYFINVQQNLEALKRDRSVESWDLTIPRPGTCQGRQGKTSTTLLATVGAGRFICSRRRSSG